jgi:hypothetical protein
MQQMIAGFIVSPRVAVIELPTIVKIAFSNRKRAIPRAAP